MSLEGEIQVSIVQNRFSTDQTLPEACTVKIYFHMQPF